MTPEATESIAVRRAAERGHADLGWLDTWHTFSFGTYHDPAHMGFRALRVINEDFVEPGQGFGEHGHRDMEIVTYVLDGSVRHADDMGHGQVVPAGDVQRMTAGTGVRHSEFNPSATERMHMLQIWIEPDRQGLAPSYEQRGFPSAEKRGRLRALVTPDGRDGSLSIHQDASLYGALLEPGEAVRHALVPGRHAWVQVARGALDLQDGTRLAAGDGAALSGWPELVLTGVEPAEVLVFDLA